MDWRTTAAGELDLSGGEIQMVDGTDAIRQDVECRLRFFQGEWFLAPGFGVPYFQAVLVKNPDVALVRSTLARAILATPGVKSLLSLDLRYEPADRSLEVTYRASTDLGELGGTLDIGASA